jgi:hypothetical protein
MCVAVEAVPVGPISDSKYMSRSSLTPRTPACPLQPNRLLQSVRPRLLGVLPTLSPPRPLKASSTTSSPPICRVTNSRPCVTGWSSLCKAYRQTGNNVRSMGLQGSQETLGLCRNRSDQTIDTDMYERSRPIGFTCYVQSCPLGISDLIDSTSILLLHRLLYRKTAVIDATVR